MDRELKDMSKKEKMPSRTSYVILFWLSYIRNKITDASFTLLDFLIEIDIVTIHSNRIKLISTVHISFSCVCTNKGKAH